MLIFFCFRISNITNILFSAHFADVGARAESFLGRINLKKCRTAKQPPIFLQLATQPTPHQPPPALAPMPTLVQSNLASASPILTSMLSEPTTKQKQAYSGTYTMHDLKQNFLFFTIDFSLTLLIFKIGRGKGHPRGGGIMPFLN